MLQTELIRVPGNGFYFFTQTFNFPQHVQSFFFTCTYLKGEINRIKILKTNINIF